MKKSDQDKIEKHLTAKHVNRPQVVKGSDHRSVIVEFNDKNWCVLDTGEARQATQTEIDGVFQTWATATNTTCGIARGTKPLSFWYCEFQVPKERVQAFKTAFDWTMAFQVVDIR